MANSGVEQGPQKWALLIGINDYPSYAPEYQLKGCINDIEAIEKVLTSNQFCFPMQNIKKLTSPAAHPSQLATRDNILAAFHTHLIENIAIQRGDIVIIYYSGHGSYMPDSHNDEDDGYDETIVPCDSGENRGNPDHVRDISDDEIALLLDELEKRTKNINLFFDSCHSGTVTRDLQEAEDHDAQGHTRWLPPATCVPPTQFGLHIPSGDIRLSGPSGWLPLSDGYVLLSACRDSERAREKQFWVRKIPPKRKWHGIFTRSLLAALQELDTQTTYYDIWDAVQKDVIRHNRWQAPQVEGAFERRVFGGAISPRGRHFDVTAVNGNGLMLNSGLVHGTTIGSRFAVYPPGIQVFDDKAMRLAIVRLEEVDTFSATGIVEEGDMGRVVIGAPIIEIEHNYGSMQMSVRIEGIDPMLDEVRQLIDQSPLLIQAKQDALSRVTVRLRHRLLPDGRYDKAGGQLLHILSSGDGHPLVTPVALSARGPAIVCDKLEHVAKYNNVLAIANTHGENTLRDQIKLCLFRVIGEEENDPDSLQPVTRNEGGSIELKVGERVVLKVENRSAIPVHIALLDCATDWQIHPIFPLPGSHDDLVNPGEVRRILRFKVDLPDYQKPVDRHLPLPREIVKLIATTKRVPFRNLWLPELRKLPEPDSIEYQSLLFQLLKLTVDGAEYATRKMEHGQNQTIEDWTTDELIFYIVT